MARKREKEGGQRSKRRPPKRVEGYEGKATRPEKRERHPTKRKKKGKDNSPNVKLKPGGPQLQSPGLFEQVNHGSGPSERKLTSVMLDLLCFVHSMNNHKLL